MPTISIFCGIYIMMYLREKEHNPPHIHAFYGNNAAKFFIETGELMDGSLPSKAEKLVKKFIKKYKNELLDMWETGIYKKLKGIE